MRQLYAVWPARSQLFCGGVCMTGPCVLMSSIVWILTLGPVAFYCAIVLPTAFTWHPVLPVASVALFALMVALLLATCCTDPGVIPPRAVILAAGSAEEISRILGYSVLGAGEPTHVQELDECAMVPEELWGLGYNWCHTCEIIRPPRASHCRFCDQCVLRFDHHCILLNNCIAQRNYVFFVGFLCSVVCSALFGISVSFWWLDSTIGRRGPRRWGTRMKSLAGNVAGKPSMPPTSYIVIGVSVVVGLLSILVLCFLAYHFFLIATGRTTKEYQARPGASFKSRPTIWGPRGPRLFNPRVLVPMEVLIDAREAAAHHRPQLRLRGRLGWCQRAQHRQHSCVCPLPKAVCARLAAKTGVRYCIRRARDWKAYVLPLVISHDAHRADMSGTTFSMKGG